MCLYMSVFLYGLGAFASQKRMLGTLELALGQF